MRSRPGAILLLVASLAVAAPASAQQAIEGRACHAMTWAGNVNRVIVMGGAPFCGTRVLRDSGVWSWDGARWATLGTSVAPREDMFIAYAARRNVVVAYGGRASGAISADTWEWDGKSWEHRADGRGPGPGAVEHAAVAYDSTRDRVVLFGGARGRTQLNETWEWDGARWNRASADGPPARVAHSMTWSAKHGLLMYGGFGEKESFRDLWRWDGARWTLVDSSGPAYTEGPGLVAAGDELFILGKPVAVTGDVERFSFWRRRGAVWILDSNEGPPFTIGQGLAYDASRGALVLFGGAPSPSAAPSSSVWEYRGGRWQLSKP